MTQIAPSAARVLRMAASDRLQAGRIATEEGGDTVEFNPMTSKMAQRHAKRLTAMYLGGTENLPTEVADPQNGAALAL